MINDGSLVKKFNLAFGWMDVNVDVSGWNMKAEVGKGMLRVIAVSNHSNSNSNSKKNSKKNSNSNSNSTGLLRKQA